MRHNYMAVYGNIRVRPLCKSDTEYLRIWRNNPQNSRYLRRIKYIDSEMQKKWFENYLENDDEITFAVEETKELKQLVGSASLYNFHGKQATFGKILIGNEKAHGKKAGKNTVIAVLSVAFGQLGLEKINLECYAENSKAVHIYKSVGFKICDEHITDENRREYFMDISKKEFDKLMLEKT